jgi:asparagine synthase (glutamine-hydrolysing)
MCGIAGLIDPTGAPVPRDVVERMTAAIAPRGPDAAGFHFAPGVGLGHRRLAIIDLSPTGAQPMADATGTVHVVFNGEIYNFMDLRAELQGRGRVFRSRSDTEVLVHGWQEWGEALVERLEGMFAFAIWDADRRRVFAARDRMGKKPLYYAQVARPGAPPLFAFGSELKALLPVPGLDRRIDPEALSRYLAYEYVPPPRSIFRGVRKLDASERLVLDLAEDPAAAPVVGRYWDLPFPEEHTALAAQEAAEELTTLLRRAVERRLVSDVPLGVFLSGGIDSSTVAAVMASLAGADRIKTFAVGFSDASFDETEHARLVARHLGTDHKEERLDPARMLDILPEVFRFLDEPLADASIVPTYLLSRFTRQHVTVALGGDGGDELFAGYPTFKAHLPGKLFFEHLPASARALCERAAALLPAKTGYFSLDFKVNQFLRGGAAPGPRRHQRWMCSFLPEEQASLLTPDLRAAAGGDPLDDIEARLGDSSARDERDRLMAFYARFYMAGGVLTKVDRASGACGLEVRAPLLDTDVVSFACQIPPELRLHRLTSKYVLKRAMRGKLPDQILDRKKQGFGVPVARWMKEELAPLVRDELALRKLAREGLFDPTYVQGLIDDHLTGRRDRRKALWTLLVFERWLGTYGSGGP